jgi:hypothetical protein
MRSPKPEVGSQPVPLPPASLRPFAVPLRREARRLLGNKSYSSIYEAIGRGELTAVKDGQKTLLTLESIERYMRSLPAAKIKPPTPRRPHQSNSDRRRRRSR